MWVVQLLIAQLAFGYIGVVCVFCAWKLLNPGKKIW